MSKREDLEALAARAREELVDAQLQGLERGPPAPRFAHLPTPAVTYGAGLGVPASYVLVWIFQTYLFGGSMPPDVAAAFGALIAAGVGWLFQRFGSSPGEGS